MATVCMTLGALTLVGSLMVPSIGRGAEVDWDAVRETSVVEILTVDPDGDARETKIWIVVMDEAGWVRTGNSRWLANIRRDPEVSLRVGERTFELLAEEVTGAEARGAIEPLFREKYGWVQTLMSFFRTREPNVLRLTPR